MFSVKLPYIVIKEVQLKLIDLDELLCVIGKILAGIWVKFFWTVSA